MTTPQALTQLVAWTALAVSTLAATPDLIIADFEGETYGDWTVTGEAFGPGPARGTLPGQMHVDGFQGRGLVNSFYRGDTTTGTLTSPPFTLQRRFITFLIGGGKDAERTCMNLLIDGQIVRTATGPNDRPGGSETLARESWDVSEFAGKTAVLQIVDQATGGWGHINVDHIVQTDRKPPGLLTNARRTFTIAHRYLHFPVKNGAPNASSPPSSTAGSSCATTSNWPLPNLIGGPSWTSAPGAVRRSPSRSTSCPRTRPP
ncbi:MAG: hypothetical protein M5U12_25895 [Verrucomicrobia bacterium]|nr:hypothetical protein [Verrucomicrobiota bacterium]